MRRDWGITGLLIALVVAGVRMHRFSSTVDSIQADRERPPITQSEPYSTEVPPSVQEAADGMVASMTEAKVEQAESEFLDAIDDMSSVMSGISTASPWNSKGVESSCQRAISAADSYAPWLATDGTEGQVRAALKDVRNDVKRLQMGFRHRSRQEVSTAVSELSKSIDAYNDAVDAHNTVVSSDTP